MSHAVEGTISLSKIRKAATVSVEPGALPIPPAVSREMRRVTLSDEPRAEDPQTAYLEQLVQARLAEANLQYEALLERARAEAAQMLASAEEQAQRLQTAAEQQGRSDGYTAGYAEGLNACQETCTTLVTKAQDVVRQTEEYRAGLLRSMVEPLTAITMEALSAMLRRELQESPANVAEMVEHLLQFVLDSSLVEVRVHPDDFSLATTAHPRWKSAKFGEWEVSIVPDLSVARGGCEIRSEYGRIDARVETRLELLQEHLQQAVTDEVTNRVG